jgi:hypothetical protein
LDLHGQLGEVLEAMMRNREYYEFLGRAGYGRFFNVVQWFLMAVGCLMVCLHLLRVLMAVIDGFRGGSMVNCCFFWWFLWVY